MKLLSIHLFSSGLLMFAPVTVYANFAEKFPALQTPENSALREQILNSGAPLTQPEVISKKFNLYGSIVHEKKPLRGARVRLERKDILRNRWIMVRTVFTDRSGNYGFPHLSPAHIYRIRVTAQGYHEGIYSDIRAISENVVVNLALIK